MAHFVIYFRSVGKLKSMTPLVTYFRSEGELKSTSTYITSDCLHDTVTVHTFISTVLSHVKTEIPMIKKVVYFSDRAASQDLCHHTQDTKLVTEWHFFCH